MGRPRPVVDVPVGSLPLTLPPGGAVIVRPDRYVAAVAHDAAELAAASTALLDPPRPAQPTEGPHHELGTAAPRIPP